MANLTPVASWDNVPQLETTTLALGGPGGPMNSQAQAILNRFAYFGTAAGATKINYLYGTVAAKLGEWKSPIDESAVGDGVADDTSEIISLVAANPGRLFNGAGKTYKISSNLPGGFRMLDGMIVDTRTVTTQDDYSVLSLGQQAGAANTFVPESFSASGGRFFAAGNHNVYIGGQAAKSNTVGRRNVIIGSRSALGGVDFAYTTAVGSHALEGLTSGYHNVALGTQAGQNMSTGEGNTLCGVSAGNKVRLGSYNSALGYSCMSAFSAALSSAEYNCAFGYRALAFLETGVDNIAIGRDAGVTMTDGTNNVLIGSNSLVTSPGETNMTAVGFDTLRFLSGAAGPCTVGGYGAARTLTTGGYVTLWGTQAGYSATTAINLTGIGHQSMLNVTTGNNNTGLGRSSGSAITTGGSNTMLGDSTSGVATADNQTSVGYAATCTASNQVTLGNASVSSLRCQVTTITALSDERDKKDIQPLADLLPDSFIDEVEAVAYRWAMRDGTDRGDALNAGVIAQQLKRLQDKYGLQWLNLVDETNPDRLEATPGNLLMPLLVRVQRQEKRLRSLGVAVHEMGNAVAELKARMDGQPTT